MSVTTDDRNLTVAAGTMARLEPASPSAEPATTKRRLIIRTAPPWLVSLLMHLLLLLTLGLVTLTDRVNVTNILTVDNRSDEIPEIEEFTIDDSEPEAVLEEPLEQAINTQAETELEAPSEFVATEIAPDVMRVEELASEIAAPATSLQSLTAASTPSLSGRDGEAKAMLLQKYGGNQESESAVQDALNWFRRHQLPNGAWTYNHTIVCGGKCSNPGHPMRAAAFNAATAMALLPYLGAGHTHKAGKYRDVVKRGLQFLLQSGRREQQQGRTVLSYREGPGNMYSHGLVAITLCEAYAMTGDEELALPAQQALDYIEYAQCSDGGWRYFPKFTFGGDTSVTGWQIMALKSGHMGGLVVSPETIGRATQFLDSMASRGGAWYGYDRPSPTLNHSNTSIGLLCRMYTGWDKSHPAIVSGVNSLAFHGVDRRDIYYDYYAAQVLRHFGGPQWEKFNLELRDWLVATQAKKRDAKGSWHFPDSKFHRGPREGGRLASTSFATMILEVYYRHMPLYAEIVADAEFPL